MAKTVFLPKHIQVVHIFNFTQMGLLKCTENMIAYNRDAMHSAGVGIAIDIDDDYNAFLSRINAIFKEYQDEEFSYQKYSFDSFEFIICRYFNFLPRVKREAQLHLC